MSINPIQPLRVGIVGMGHWGPHLVRTFYDHPECKVVAICDTEVARLALAKESYPGVRCTKAPLELIQDPEINTIAIATPTHTHYELTLAALKAGKNVFVEKPLTTDLEKAQELILLARNRGLKLFVGHVFLFNPAIQYIRRALDENLLGKLFYFYFRRTNLGPVRADVNALWDLGTHDIAVLHYLMADHPTEVIATGSSFLNPPVEDVVFAHLKYANGVSAHLQVSWIDPRKVREMVIVGSKKMLVFEDTLPENPIKIFNKGVGKELSESGISDTLALFRKSIFQGEIEMPQLNMVPPLKVEVQAFVDWVLRDVPHGNTDALTLAVVRTLSFAQASLTKTRNPVSEIHLKFAADTNFIEERNSPF